MKNLEVEPLPEINISILPDWQQRYKCANFQAWYNMNECDPKFIYKELADNQFTMLRDYFTENEFECSVISTHTSKSVLLPVCHFKKDEIEFIIRGNFHNWIITVNSENDLIIPVSFINDFKKINPVYCEGFKNKWCLEGYETNKKEFTISIPYSREHFYILFYLLLDNSNLTKFFSKTSKNSKEPIKINHVGHGEILLSDIQKDVNSAISNGNKGMFAFTPETVQSLINKIIELS